MGYKAGHLTDYDIFSLIQMPRKFLGVTPWAGATYILLIAFNLAAALAVHGKDFLGWWPQLLSSAAILILWRWAARKHARHLREMQRLVDRQDDAKSRCLNDYYSAALRVGEWRAYQVMIGIYNDATLKGLGIYKTPDEVKQLREADR